ncbi:MAG: electron transfer flavoprotein subunit beta [Gammaproteobacteria bacterium]|nr:electron transfer flavoprotein subunit beta [Gammaproteobacteria bacterium]
MSLNHELSIVTLVSVGEHPASGRARRAEQDARAVELGLKLVGDKLQTIYAGSASDKQATSALRSYLGMGLSEVILLDLPEQADAAIGLVEHFKSSQCPDIILTGVRAESGESSGMMPYLLAEQLGMTVISSIADILSIDVNAKQAEILQALPRGQRRKVKVSLPLVASVDMAASEPRQSAFGPAMRGQINAETSHSEDDIERLQWQTAPAKKRPKRLKIVKAKTAADRFKAATAKAAGGGGKVVHGTQESAQAIFDLLKEEGML